MCGLIISQSRDHVVKGLKTMEHRGIRSTVVQVGKWWVGHRRMPINGLGDLYDHPMEVKPYFSWMVGEYYDFDASTYTSDLLALTHKLVHGDYHPEGMYHAILLTENTFDIYQDGLYKKPLYYRRDVKAYASEIKALTCLGPVTPNKLAYHQYKKFGYSCTETPYEEISLVLGRKIKVSNMGVPLAVTPKPVEVRDLTLLQAIKQAVTKRLKSDAKLAVLCSGGLDSSIVYQLVRDAGHNPHVFHIENGEREYVDLLNIPKDRFHTVSMDQTYSMREILYHNETPADLGSMVPQFLLGEAIRYLDPEIRVVLTGDGADEIFGGYKRCLRSKKDLRSSDLIPELIGYHLPRLDKQMMAHMLEVRSPFLDEQVVHLAHNTEWEDLKGKQPLKQVARALAIPQEIINREKVPLKSPIIKKDKLAWRKKMIRKFRRHFERGLEL